MDCIERTVLFTDLTCDTTNGAVGDYVLTHIFGRTLYFNFLFRGQQFDDMFRTCGYTFTTSYTFIFIDYSYAVNDFDGTESTCFLTAAQTQTTIGARFCTLASQLNCEVTVIDTEVIIFIFCFIASAATFYESSNGFGRRSFNTHDNANFFSNCCTTNGTSIYGSCTSYDSRCATTTTGETATTTVSAGQTFQNLTDSGVFVYFEDFTCYTQTSAENNAQTTDTQDGEYNTHWIHILLPSFITV